MGCNNPPLGYIKNVGEIRFKIEIFEIYKFLKILSKKVKALLLYRPEFAHNEFDQNTILLRY